MDFGSQLKKYRKAKKMTQVDLGSRVGLSGQVISNLERGYTTGLSPEMIQNIASVLDVSISELTSEENLQKNTKQTIKSGQQISVLGRVAAGIPIEAIEEIIDTEEISEDLAKTGEFFGLQIHGDSMEPRFTEGDVVIVRKQDDAESGDIVIATVNGDEATCKRLRKYRDGIELVSTNLSYKPMFFTNKEIMEKPVKILGKVVELRAKF